jgi:hypothetical protein
MKAILIFALTFAGLVAQADQCAYNTKTDGTSAKLLIQNNTELIDWCLNCDQKKPGLIYVVTAVKVDKGTNEVMVKGIYKSSRKPVTEMTTPDGWHMIDLAYTYVRTASDVFTNLSHLVGCPSSGSYSFIQTIGNSKRPHYYDNQGVRQDYKINNNIDIEVMPVETVGSFVPETGRKPANTKKKTH